MSLQDLLQERGVASSQHLQLCLNDSIHEKLECPIDKKLKISFFYNLLTTFQVAGGGCGGRASRRLDHGLETLAGSLRLQPT